MLIIGTELFSAFSGRSSHSLCVSGRREALQRSDQHAGPSENVRLRHQRPPGRLCGQNTGCRLQTLHGGTSHHAPRVRKPTWRGRCWGDGVLVIPFTTSRGRQPLRQKHKLSLKWVLSFLWQPERINPDLNQKGYSVKSDIWSLGITMVSTIVKTRLF